MPLTRGVIDTLAGPPVTQLVASATLPTSFDNPHTGAAGIFALWDGIQAYGLQWAVVTAPDGAGLSNRAGTVYELDFLHFALEYRLSDATTVFGEHVRTGVASGLYMFENALPVALVYDISAGWYVNFRWLIAP